MADMPKIEPGLRVRLRDSGQERIVGEALLDDDGESWPLIIPGTEKWRISIDTDEFWNWLEPVDPDPEPTIAVPVTLIEAAAEQIHCSALASQLTALLPKPPAPRLVAVDLRIWQTMTPYEISVHACDQPDLLDQINEAIDGVPQTTDGHIFPEQAKRHLRRKLTGDAT